MSFIKQFVKLSIFLFVINNVTVFAQDTSYRFKNFSQKEGLSQSTVYSFIKDDLGYIWIGTKDGLNRFDAVSFLKFYPSNTDSNSISNRSIRALVKDSVGYIWVGTDGGGVDRLDPKTNQFIKLCDLSILSECVSELNVTSLNINGNKLLIGTRNRGLFSFHLDDKIFKKEIETSSTIWDIVLTEDFLWLATSGGVLKVEKNLTENFLPEDNIRALKVLGNSSMLIGSKDHGVLKMDIRSNKIEVFSDELIDKEISSLGIDGNKQIWIGTDNNGIFITDNQGRAIAALNAPKTSNDTDLKNNSIRTIYTDENDLIWIGLNNAGFSNYYKYRYQFESFSTENTNRRLPGDVVLSFNELDNGDILIGLEQNGLAVHNIEENSYNTLSAFSDKNIIAILKDSKKQIWVATDGWGLNLIKDQSELNSISTIDNLTNESVLSLHEGSSGLILVGTYKGLNLIENGVVQNRDFIPDYLQDDRVLAIESLNEEEYLIGTFSNGLIYFKNNSKDFRRLTSSSKNNSTKKETPERVQSIYTDTNGRIWLGTYSGLVQFDRKNEQFNTYTTADGLPNDVVYGILEDSNNTLWLSTNAGISNFDPEKETFINYSIQDGLLSNEFNGGAYFKDSRGIFYFGGIKGFTAFIPEKIKNVSLSGEIRIHSLNVDGSTINTITAEDIEIQHDQDYIQFEFSYLNFANADKYKLEYRLSGLSENWIPVNSRRSINFSGLQPGEYEFSIRALNNLNGIETVSKSIPFYIKSPFWKTWYFAVALVIVLFGAIYSLFKYRMYFLLKEERTRNKIARDLHDDLSATLSSISFFSEAAKRNQLESSGKYLQRIDESAIEAKEKINDIIWAIDPENDDWEAFLTKCKRYAAEMFESKNIDYQINFGNAVYKITDYSLRQDLWLVFKELVTNVVRHSEASNARVSLKKKKSVLQLIIEDDGIGLKDKDLDKGNGISNLRYRSDRMGAILKIESNSPSGTRVVLSISV
jgi:ligand-binding sensor domain-containing protein/signal transduction histidine kinase